MDIVYVLLPATIAIALVFLGFYLWAAHSGQFDDLDTAQLRVLVDDASHTGTPTPMPNEHSRPVEDHTKQ